MKGALLSVLVLGALLLPGSAWAEYIESFDSRLEVHTDSSFDVTEIITNVFTEARHGIYRNIPLTHPEPPSAWYKERYIDIQVNSVSMDGMEVPYSIDRSGSEVSIKIGDPNKTITDTHTYTISYRVMGGMVFPKYGGAEVYWNVTGTQWQVPIRSVTASMYSTDSLFTRERSCYRGREQEAGSCERSQGDAQEVSFATTHLAPGEGMTIAQAVDRTRVEQIELERLRSIILWPIFLLIWFVALGVFVYRYRTAFDTDRPIIAQYEPYPGVKPMYSGLLIDGRLDPRDITACIVYLAEQGYLKIHKTEKKVLFFFEVDDYEIELLKSPDASISSFEQSILSLLFEHGAVVGTKVSLHTLKHDLEQQRKNHKTIELLKVDLERDLKESGFFQVSLTMLQLLGLLAGALFLLGVSVYFLRELSITVFYIFFLITASGFILSFAARRRTLKGYEAKDHLKGFKEFLSVTDKERFEFHNAPEKSPKQFMEYLPYAIAFGVEEKWADVFKDMSIPNPDWYDGGAAHSFSATNLTTSLGAFSTAFAASSGSSSSASSGGGSVGGGGGGGGGGSW